MKLMTCSRKIQMALATAFVALGFANPATAGINIVPGGYEVNYDVVLHSLPTNGGDILGTYIFEWNDTGDFNVELASSVITGKSTTFLTHTIDFEPTQAFLIGYAVGISGVGDGKDHLFTFMDVDFAAAAVGRKWSTVFPGLTPDTRVSHSAMVSLLISAGGGDLAALGQLTNFVQAEGYLGGFDPAGGFAAIEWTIGNPDVPEPGTMCLLAMGVVGVLLRRRRS